MLAKFIGIVKQQIEYWRYQVANFGPDHPRYRPAKIAKYEYLIRDFSELLAFLERQAAQEAVENPLSLQERATTFFVSPQQAAAGRQAPEVVKEVSAAPSNIPDDLADLPVELLNELSESIKGETDQLIKIINDRGGTATLDEILIDLWRKYKEIGKRPIVSNRLYRLSRRGLCWPLPGRKGVYTTTKPTSGNDTPQADDGDNGDVADTSQQSAPQPTRKEPFFKARRDLFASTAIPRDRVS